MCTAIGFGGRYFCRTLDYESDFGAEIIISPEGCVDLCERKNVYKILGIGVDAHGVPLYFDGVNECGLAMAGLNFPHFAKYNVGGEGSATCGSGQLISLILGICRNVEEAREVLHSLRITDDNPSCFGSSPLHWMLYDKNSCIVVEPLAGGLSICDNPVCVMTNSPEFSYHLRRLADFRSLTAGGSADNLCSGKLLQYSRGMGAIGLPGDFSSVSRFVRAVFLRENIRYVSGDTMDGITAGHRMLNALSVPRGCVRSERGEPVSTIYSCVADLEDVSYYVSTYRCQRLCRVNLAEHTTGKALIKYALPKKEDVLIPE